MQEQKAIVEALIFSCRESLSASKATEVVEGLTRRDFLRVVEELNREYEREGRAFRIEEVGGGYRLYTLAAYSLWINRLKKQKGEERLSSAALETLAIVAYKQPIQRVDVEAVRGVQSGPIIRSLMEKGLVKIVGRSDVLGRPLLYGTTKAFLEHFGLRSLDDLPKIREFK